MATDIDWPATLPRPSASFSLNLGYFNDRLEMETTRVRQWPTTTKGVGTARLTFEFTAAELAEFKLFFSGSLNQGALSFNIDIPNGNGSAVSTTEVLFVTPYDQQYNGFDDWSVTAEVEYDAVASLAPGTFTPTYDDDDYLNWPEAEIDRPTTFGVDAEWATIQTKLDGGRITSRPRATTRIEQAKVEWECDLDQFAAFKFTVEELLNRGNDWFNIALPVPDAATRYTTVRARFADDFSASYATGDVFRVSTSLEYEIPAGLFANVTRRPSVFGDTNGGGGPGDEFQPLPLGSVTLTDHPEVAGRQAFDVARLTDGRFVVGVASNGGANSLKLTTYDVDVTGAATLVETYTEPSADGGGSDYSLAIAGIGDRHFMVAHFGTIFLYQTAEDGTGITLVNTTTYTEYSDERNATFIHMGGDHYQLIAASTSVNVSGGDRLWGYGITATTATVTVASGPNQVFGNTQITNEFFAQAISPTQFGIALGYRSGGTTGSSKRRFHRLVLFEVANAGTPPTQVFNTGVTPPRSSSTASYYAIGGVCFRGPGGDSVDQALGRQWMTVAGISGTISLNLWGSAWDGETTTRVASDSFDPALFNTNLTCGLSRPDLPVCIFLLENTVTSNLEFVNYGVDDSEQDGVPDVDSAEFTRTTLEPAAGAIERMRSVMVNDYLGVFLVGYSASGVVRLCTMGNGYTPDPVTDPFDYTTWPDIDQTTLQGTSPSFSSREDVFGLQISPDGKHYAYPDQVDDRIYTGYFSTPYDVGTLTQFGITDQNLPFTSISMNEAGTVVFAAESSNIHSYHMPVRYRNTVDKDTYIAPVSVSAMFVDKEGTRVFFTSFDEIIRSLTLTTPWDLSTATADVATFDVSSELITPRDIQFRPDGLKMYVMDNLDTIHQYSLSIAWDLTTITPDNVSVTLTTQDSQMNAFWVIDDGTMLFTYGNNNEQLFRYDLEA